MSCDIPEIVVTLYKEKRWPELLYAIRAKWDQEAWRYLKANGNAVQRILQEFRRLTGQQPYQNPANARYWNQQIAKYIDRLGVAALVDDMRAAVKGKPDILSMVYFLHSRERVPRWERLLLDKIAREAAEQSSADNDAYRALAKLLGYDGSIGKIHTNETPQWVLDARRRLEQIAAALRTATSGDRIRLLQEQARLQDRLERFGYGHG